MFKRPATLLFAFFLLASATAATRSGYIPAGKLKLYYEVSGSGPVVVLLHGGYLDLHSWDREASALAGKYTVVRFDLPGHGKTNGADTTLRVQDVVRIVLDSLHIRKASVVGLSLGGACAADFALAYPERIKKLVLVSAGLSGWPDVMQLDTLSKRLFNLWDSVYRGDNHQQITETFTRLWCDGPFRKPGDVSAAIRRYISRTVAANDWHNNRSWPVFNTNRAAKRVHTITVPVLILAGDKDVPFIIAAAKYIHGQIKGSQLHIIHGPAHMINLEKPALFNHYLRNFLRS